MHVKVSNLTKDKVWEFQHLFNEGQEAIHHVDRNGVDIDTFRKSIVGTCIHTKTVPQGAYSNNICTKGLASARLMQGSLIYLSPMQVAAFPECNTCNCAHKVIFVLFTHAPLSWAFCEILYL